jgi:hypothetical protein
MEQLFPEPILVNKYKITGSVKPISSELNSPQPESLFFSNHFLLAEKLATLTARVNWKGNFAYLSQNKIYLNVFFI